MHCPKSLYIFTCVRKTEKQQLTYPSLQKLNWFIYKINKKGLCTLCVTCSAAFANNESDVILNYICVKSVFDDRLCNLCNFLYLDNVILIELVIIFSSHSSVLIILFKKN